MRNKKVKLVFSSLADAAEYRLEQIMKAYAAAQTEIEFISGEAVIAWVESWDTPEELPAPKPDLFRS